MNILRALAIIATWAATAQAATTTTVVDIAAPSGGTQRFVWVRPDAPIATLVNIPGGTGNYNFNSDGSSFTPVGVCSPPYRTRAELAARGIAVVLIDATSLGSVGDPRDVLAVVNEVRGRDTVPVWISGGSASTASTALAAVSLPPGIPAGVLFVSPDRPSSRVPQITRPAGVIYHTGDSQAFGNLMYNALTSAVARERIAISGGVDAGCGFHLFNGTEAELIEATVGIITRNNAATMGSAAPNVQGLWFNPNESGWGVNLTQQGGILFGTWFTYDTDGRGMWLVMPGGTRSGNGWTGALYRTTGPAFSSVPFNPQQVVPTQVGTATFTFADGDNGTFQYTVGGASQSKAITRQVFGPLPTCTEGGTHGASPNYQALWWSDPPEGESGWGLNVAHQGDIVFATWFTYDTDGRGMWLVMPSGARTGPGTYAGALYRTTGTPFSSAWVNAALGSTEVGSASLAFQDADHGTFTYTVGGVTQSKAITRQVYGAPATVCR